ncbi:MAG: ABC transporter permease, partial [Lysobacter sp.]|nr:ABC transporter permease [Lysobacter sp.]
MRDESRPPSLATDGSMRLQLQGNWTLVHAATMGEQLRLAPDGIDAVDASDIESLDSAGVLLLLRFARRRGLDLDSFHFRDDQQSLVAAIEDVADDRPPKKREYGVSAALARLGFAVHDNYKEILALIGFLGENLMKFGRMLAQPRRFRLTSTVYHMEQVGLDAVPLVFLLSYLVGAVIAFLGANILRDFGAEIYVVELVSVAFLREFAVLLTAIILAGRTA